MLYYIKSGNLSITQSADSYKQAVMIALVGREEYFGKLVIVDTTEIMEESNRSQMFFLTEALISERDCGMRLVY
jgi:hypothetical protein